MNFERGKTFYIIDTHNKDLLNENFIQKSYNYWIYMTILDIRLIIFQVCKG